MLSHPISSKGRLANRLRQLSSLLCLLLCSVLTATATDDTKPDRGLHSNGSYSISDIETISTTSGNLMLHIPLGSLPAGRGGLSAGLSLIYNSKEWDSFNTYAPGEPNPNETQLKESSEGGWHYGLQYELQLSTRPCFGPNPSAPSCIYKYKVSIKSPDGAMHTLRLNNSQHSDYLNDAYYAIAPGSLSTTMSYYSTDNSYMRLEVAPGGMENNYSWTLYLPDGTRVFNNTPQSCNATQCICDRNNNFIYITNGTYGPHAATSLSDQMGRSLILEYNSGVNQDSVHLRGTNYEEAVWTITWKTITLNKGYLTGSADQGTLTDDVRVVDRVTMPAQAGSLFYSFDYNPTAASPGWGEINKVTLPSGAYATYKYQLDGVNWAYATDVLKNRVTQKELNYQMEYDGVTQWAATQTWTYAIGQVNSTITGPDGGVMQQFYYNTESKTWDAGLVYKTVSPDGMMTEQQWVQNTPYGSKPDYGSNSYAAREFTSIKNAAGSYVSTAIKETSYDKNGNLTRVKEYDWVDYGNVPRDADGRPTGVPAGAALKRVRVSSYYNATPDAADTTTDSANAYHRPGSPRLHQAVASSEVSADGINASARTEFTYDDASLTGNLVQQRSWDSSKGAYSNPLTTNNSVSTSIQYDAYGNVTLSTDAMGRQTKYDYDAINGYTNLYPTQVRTAYQTSVQRTRQMQYDFYTGLLTRALDVDNNVATATTYDVFGRPTLVKAAEGRAEETRTLTTYDDFARRVIVRSDLNVVGDGKLVQIQHYDQLGRVRLSRQLEDSATQSATDEQAGIKVQTRYLISGSYSYKVVSNPYRASNSAGASTEGTMGWTRSKTDNGGRLIEAQTFGGAGLPDPWGTNSSGTGTVQTSYDANFTTVQDQQQKVRRSMTDALGRLVRVDEADGTNTVGTGTLGSTTAPNRPTSYSYDALGNLTQVTQGIQTRSFQYSSLSRLTSAFNPESGTVTYQYDNNGNLTSKTDARPVTTAISYDALNRVVSKSYNDGLTPTVNLYYDGATLGKGRLWQTQTTDPANRSSYTAIDTYDALGRPRSERQQFYYYNSDSHSYTWSQNYTVQRSYDLAGHVLTQSYPSGHAVTYGYDAAGRTQSFAGSLGDGTQRNYSTGITYSQLGTLSQEQLGTTVPVFNKHFYNSRGQLSEIRESTTGGDTSWNRGAIINQYAANCWACAGPDDNGNLLRQEIYIPNNDQVSSYTSWSEGYFYDNLNRLSYTHEYTGDTQKDWQQAYTYDRWGNRTIDQNNTYSAVGSPIIPHPQFNVDTSTNRLTVPAGQSGVMSYDAAGNLYNDTYTSYGQRTFDAENRMLTARDVSGGTSTYIYDAEGKRVRRIINNSEVWQIYGMDGELLSEYAAAASPTSTPQKEYGYRNGELLITAAPSSNGQSANLSQGKPATESSNLYGAASLAVDGNTSGNFTDNSVTHTNYEAQAWWQVDLGSIQTIQSIQLYNRTDCCSDRLSNFYLFVSDQPFTSTDLQTTINQSGVWNNYTQEAVGVSSTIAVNRTGRYVRVQLAGTNVLSLAEVQVMGQAAGGAGTDIEWLVTDQLGTPRMVLEQSGSLAGMKRHDYLPFGEELFAGTGLRTSQMGYIGDNVRQKFTGYERDSETGLDYAQARYYASTQGRFTSADPVNTVITERAIDPQQINLYAYTRNNPLKFVDSSGMTIDASKLSDEEKKEWEEIVKLANAKDELGAYVNPELHNVYQRLNGDKRTFIIQNHSFGDRSGTTGEFKITKFDGANDFSEAVIQLDFKKVQNQTGPSSADLAPGFNKFEGLFGVKNEATLRLAELFGHEGSHAVFALDDVAGATKLQRLLNDRDAALAALPKMKKTSDYPPDVKQLMEAADRALVPTERFAQQNEERINRELNPALRGVNCKKK